MTYIKIHVPAYEDIITWKKYDVYQRFRKYDCFLGDGKSIDYIEKVLKSYYEKD